MLEGVADLTLAQLNEATSAWIEMEYHRSVHSETGQTPVHRYLHDTNVGRPCPDTEKLKLAFTTEVQRVQRRSDGTLSLEGVRFEIPSRYAHLEKLSVRYASWDLSAVYLSDLHTGSILCRLYPQDKKKNAQGHRAPKTPKHRSSFRHNPRLRPAWRRCSKNSSGNTPSPDCLPPTCLRTTPPTTPPHE